MENKKKIVRAVTVANSCEFYQPLIPEFRKMGYETISLSSPGPETQELKDMGVKVIEIPMQRHISLLKDFKALVSIIMTFYREKPYIVHSMTPKAGLLCMIAAWICRVPKRIHTFTGLVWPTATGIKRKILMITDRITCACATHIIPEGEGVKNDLQAHITNKKMKVLGYGNVRGVDMERWQITPNIKENSEELRRGLFSTNTNYIDNNTFVFLFVGRIVGDKGINELVEAFRKVVAKSSDWGIKTRLVLVGRYEENLDPIKPQTLEAIKNTQEILTVGEKYGNDLLAHYAAADCFVFPSYREGFPNTVLEAGAMGLPCIVTDINGSREIITTQDDNNNTNIEEKLDIRDNGIVIPSKDVDALYEAMVQMVRDTDMRQKMKDNARQMVEYRFEQGFVRKCQLEFYKDI